MSDPGMQDFEFWRRRCCPFYPDPHICKTCLLVRGHYVATGERTWGVQLHEPFMRSQSPAATPDSTERG